MVVFLAGALAAFIPCELGRRREARRQHAADLEFGSAIAELLDEARPFCPPGLVVDLLVAANAIREALGA